MGTLCPVFVLPEQAGRICDSVIRRITLWRNGGLRLRLAGLVDAIRNLLISREPRYALVRSLEEFVHA